MTRSDDLELPVPDPGRADRSGLVNEVALLAMIDSVHARVIDAVRVGRVPVVFGADCRRPTPRSACSSD